VIRAIFLAEVENERVNVGSASKINVMASMVER
jgi:hypothetical protein